MAELGQAADEIGVRVLSLIRDVASYHANYDSWDRPYAPAGPGFPSPEELEASDLAAFREVLDEVRDPDFRGRLGDMLWLYRRDHTAAQVAVNAFLESATILKSVERWPIFVERLERALQVAGQLGRGKPLHQQTLAVLETTIQEFESTAEAGRLCAVLMRLADQHGAADHARYIALSEQLARRFAGVTNWDCAWEYWMEASRWHKKRSDPAPNIQRCHIEAAECLAQKAEGILAARGPSAAASAGHWMGKAFEALRQAKAPAERAHAAHLRLRELQRQAVGEIQPIEFDPAERIAGFREFEAATQERARKAVSGCSFPEAVERLVGLTEPTDTGQLAEQVAKISEGSIHDKIGTTTAIDGTGKVLEILQPSEFGKADDAGTLRRKMEQQASMLHWQTQVLWHIDPARRAIWAEHGIRGRDLYWLVTFNPFIPPGREGIYIRGLQAGFFGDWLEATHLLIPQLEESLRHFLRQRGVETSTMDASGVQAERDINILLGLPEVQTILGPDMLFDLRGILIDRFGLNLRNNLAHGLIDGEAFYQPAVAYLWWLILRLCWIAWKKVQPPENGEPPPAG